MTRRNVVFLLALTWPIATMLGAGPATAADPEVSNVQFAQRTDGSGMVDISYDVNDADTDTLFVSVRVSHDDGATWNFPCRTLNGDVGWGVTSGTGKQIIWNVVYDDPGYEDTNFRVRVIASDTGLAHWSHSPANYAILDWDVQQWWLPETVERLAKGDFVALTGSFVWGNAGAEALAPISQIQARNGGAPVIAYVSAKNSLFVWEDPETLYPYEHTWWERTRPYWSYTTTGDTLTDWPGKPVLNILDPACREAMISTIVDYQRSSVNKFDGVFWDYFNKKLWIAPGAVFEGEPDLDGDGIPHEEDEDEKAAFQAAQVSLVEALRDSLGEGFIQFFNGQRAYGDPAFCALSDGTLYELFPTLFFPDPDMRNALDPSYENSLFNVIDWPRTQNGGPYILLANRWQNYFVDHNYQPTYINHGNSFRAVGLLTGCYSVWNRGTTSYGWTDNDINLGQPVGPTVIDGDVYTRDFDFGRLELILTSGNYPNPYDYTIWIHKVLVEQLAIPYHFP